MAIIQVEGYECERCGYQWTTRNIDDSLPTICSKCKSRLWNEPLDDV